MIQLNSEALVIGPDVLDSETILDYQNKFKQLAFNGSLSASDFQVMEKTVEDNLDVLTTTCDSDYVMAADMGSAVLGRVVFNDTHKAEITKELTVNEMKAEGKFLYDLGKINQKNEHLSGFVIVGKGKSAKKKEPTSLELASRLAFLRALSRAPSNTREMSAIKETVAMVFAKLKFMRDTEVKEGTIMAREYILAVEAAETVFAPWRGFHRRNEKELRSPALVAKCALCTSMLL